MPAYDFECQGCGIVSEVRRSMHNEEPVRCRICGEPMLQLITSGYVYSPKDKAYEFTTQHIKPGTEIRSKGQWNRFLKKNRLTDDLSIKEKAKRVEGDSFGKAKRQRHRKLMGEVKEAVGKAVGEDYSRNRRRYF